MTLEDIMPDIKEAVKLCEIEKAVREQIFYHNFHHSKVAAGNLRQIGINAGCDSTEIIYGNAPDIILGVKYYKDGKLYYPVSAPEDD